MGASIGPPAGHYPDGLDAAAIDTLIAAVDEEITRAPHPTSALTDGAAAARRLRRMARRSMTTVVRALSVARSASNEMEAA